MTKAKMARGLIAGLLVSMALVGCTNTPIAESTNANANAANAANAGKDANANASGVNGANSSSNKVTPVEVKPPMLRVCNRLPLCLVWSTLLLTATSSVTNLHP